MASQSLQVTYVGNDAGVRSTLSSMGKAHDSFGTKMQSVGRKMSSVGSSMTRNLTLPIIGVGIASVKTAMDFEKSQNTFHAVAGVSGAALDDMSDLAIKMGQDTVFSSNEAMQAMVELSKAGIAPADIKAGALASTLDLATAGDLELAEAAGIAANAMNIFGLKGDQAAQAADALVGAADASSANVDDLAQGLAQGGMAAHAAGLSLQETTGALAAFSKAGMAGSDAGTSLKTFMLNLIPTSVKAKETMHDLGLSFEDAQGNILPLTEIADELAGGMKGLTQAEQQAALKTMFGTDAYRAAQIVLENGSEGLEKYIKATSNAGNASKTAAAKMKGLPGAIESLKGSLETAALKIGQALTPVVKDAAKWITKMANAFSDMSPKTQETILKIAAFVAILGPLIKIGGVVLSPLGKMVNLFSKIGGASGAAAKGVTGMATASTEGAVATGILSSSMVGIGGVMLAAAGWVKKFKDGMIDVSDAVGVLTGPNGPIGGLVEGGFEGIWRPLIDDGYKAEAATKAVNKAITPLVGKLNAVNGTLTPLERKHLAAAQAAGDQAEATRVLNHALDRTQSAADKVNFKAFVDGVLHSAKAEDMWAQATRFGNKTTVTQSQEVGRLINSLAKNNVQLSSAKMKAVASAMAYGRSSQAIKILHGEIDKLPKAVQTKIEADTQPAEQALGAFLTKVNNSTGHVTIVGQAAGRRAAGGPVRMGSSYLVGEEGPEMFTPNRSGAIVPTGALMGGGGGGGGTTTIVNVYVAGSVLSERELLEVIKRESSRNARRNGGRSGLS